MTPQERASLENMTEAEIRRAQDLVNIQIPIAYEQRNTRALEKLQEWADDYANELMRRYM